MLRSLLLDFNAYFASVEQQVHPEWRGKPIGVVPMMAETTCCIAASYEAKAHGVTTGTRVADARRKCPGILFVVAQHGQYVEFHQRALAIIDHVAPIRRVLSIDEMEIELTGSWRQRDKAVAIAHALKAALLKDLGVCMRTSIGIAPNTLLAKLASNMQKPNGLTVLEDIDIPRAFLHLPPAAINGIGPRMNRRLCAAGITTMQQLYAAPRAVLRTVWGGVGGEQIYDGLRGQWQEIAASQGHTSISHSHVLAPNMRSRESARDVLSRLMQKAAMRLRKEGYYATALTLHARETLPSAKAGWGRYAGWERHTRLMETQDSVILLNALEALWDTSAPLKPQAVGLVLSGLVPVTQHNLSLFDMPAATSTKPSRSEEKRARLLAAVDAINRAHGKNTIYFASSHKGRDHAPMRIAFNHIPDVETEE